MSLGKVSENSRIRKISEKLENRSLGNQEREQQNEKKKKESTGHMTLLGPNSGRGFGGVSEPQHEQSERRRGRRKDILSSLWLARRGPR